MRRITTALTLVLAMTTAAFAQAADAKVKAEQILKQARAAIGDEGKLKNLQALSATGTARQTLGDRQMESEIQIDILLPDKIMRTLNQQFGTNTNVLNGDQLWNEFVPAMAAGGPGGPGGFVRFGGPGGPGGQGGPGGPGGLGADSPMAKYFQMTQRRDLLLIMIGWLLTAPPSAQLEYSYLGEAPGPEGSKLDALGVTNPAGIKAVLYLDQQTHQLIGIKYKSKQMGRAFGGRGQGGPGGQRQPGAEGGQRQRGGEGGQRQPGAQGGQPGQQGQRPELTPEERERRMKEAMENFEKAPEVDFSWALSDYKSVGGLNLPHRLTKSMGGTPNEEWEISKFKINPKLSADKFVKKEKERASN
jgi:hypothetical protein